MKGQNTRHSLDIATLQFLIVAGQGLAEPVHLGAGALVPESPRSHYSRYVNWRPAAGETVQLNPPRISRLYWPDWPGEAFADIERLDDSAVRVGADVICFDPDSRHAENASFVADVSAMRPK